MAEDNEINSISMKVVFVLILIIATYLMLDSLHTVLTLLIGLRGSGEINIENGITFFMFLCTKGSVEWRRF